MKKPKLQFFQSYEEANAKQLEEAFDMDPNDRLIAVDEIRRRLYMMKGIQVDNKVMRKHLIKEQREAG